MFAKDCSKTTGLRSACRSCESSRYYVNNTREKRQSYRRANPVKTITAWLTKGAIARAKEKNIPCDIDLDYIRSMVGKNAEFASHCPAFGTTLDWSCGNSSKKGPRPNSPSIDRIAPERGYVKGNIKIISFRANQIKSDASPSELKLVAAYCSKAIVDSLEF